MNLTTTPEGRPLAVFTFATAFTGMCVNWYVLIFIGRVSTLRNSFGQLTAAHATAETFLLTVFAFYFCPLVFFETEVLKNLAHYFAVFLLVCYDVCNYCHLLISMNRLTAIMLPLHYDTIFSSKNTRRAVIAVWIISILTCLWLYGLEDCGLFYANDYWHFQFRTNPVCNTIVWYGDFVKDFTMVIIIVVVDTITVCRVAALKARFAKNRLSSRTVDETKFLKQACVQATGFAIELVSYFIIANRVENRYLKYFLSSYAWILLHSVDGAITIYFNKEFRDFKKLRKQSKAVVSEKWSTKVSALKMNMHHRLLVFLSVVAVAAAQVANVANRTRLSKIGATFGVKVFNDKQMTEVLACADPTIYNTDTMDNTQKKIRECALKTCNKDTLGCYPVLLKANSAVNSCLKKIGSKKTATDLLDAALDASTPVLRALFKEVITKVKNDKGKGLKQLNVYENAYNKVCNIVKVKLINDVCVKIHKKMTNKEFGCAIQNIGGLVNLKAKNYKCNTLPQS